MAHQILQLPQQPDHRREENTQPVQRRVSCRRLTTTRNRGNGFLEHLTDGSDGEHVFGNIHTSNNNANTIASMMGAPSSASRRRATTATTTTNGGDAASDDEDNEFDTATEILTPTSLPREIWLGIREGAWYILLSTLVGMVVTFYTVVQTASGTGGARGVTEMGHIQTRRVPPPEEQLSMHDARMKGATTIYLDRGQVTLQGLTAAPTQGHSRLPGQFYQGIHFGLSGWNHWGEEMTHEENKERNVLLRRELESLEPRPSAVYRTTFEDGTEGFTLAYISSALAHQKGRSVRQRSDPVWLEAEQAVLAMAREFQQLIITKWYTGIWGPGHEHDPDAHSSILQQVLPTRTGLRAIASTVVVHHVQRRTPTVNKSSHPSA